MKRGFNIVGGMMVAGAVLLLAPDETFLIQFLILALLIVGINLIIMAGE